MYMLYANKEGTATVHSASDDANYMFFSLWVLPRVLPRKALVRAAPKGVACIKLSEKRVNI